jgi:predicted acyl esterase
MAPMSTPMNQKRRWSVFLAACGVVVLATVPVDAVQIERDVPVPMRDGVILRANVFRPDEPGPYPVLVLRTPYSKEGIQPNEYVKAGYIVVTQIPKWELSFL